MSEYETPRYTGVLGKLRNIQCKPWTQVLIISVVAFCCPGMYNALSGQGGSGLLDPDVAANANVALMAASAPFCILIAGPVYDYLGPKLCVFLGCWTYVLYSGSLLNFNKHSNSAFVIASGALLGIGSPLLWIPQGAIMTTYVAEHQKGMAIAVFWFIFNLGGAIGSLASFGINFHSAKTNVSDSTYIAYMVLMGFGWLVGSTLLVEEKYLSSSYVGERVNEVKKKHKEKYSWSKVKDIAIYTWKVLCDWKIAALIPMFFYANAFYSYQQNSVNGITFNIRTRALNSALYWIAQMIGGFGIGAIMDLKWFKRSQRAMIGWSVLMAYGMAVWGGGYAFEKWNESRMNDLTARGISLSSEEALLDYTNSQAVGPIFLYIFYGAYDAFWQGFCYWIIGARSNSPAVNATLVGMYKSMQSVGGAMAWRVNANGVSNMAQLGMNWGLTAGTLLCAIPAVLTVSDTSMTTTVDHTTDPESGGEEDIKAPVTDASKVE